MCLDRNRFQICRRTYCERVMLSDQFFPLAGMWSVPTPNLGSIDALSSFSGRKAPWVSGALLVSATRVQDGAIRVLPLNVQLPEKVRQSRRRR
jgi:hypothetical protein